jgi:hypothetical protein
MAKSVFCSLSQHIAAMTDANTNLQETKGADAIDVAIAQGIDFDGTPIPPAKLDLYH